MANITITIPDAVVNRVLDAVASRYNWTADLGTKAQFAKAVLIRLLKDSVKQYESNAVIQQAQTTLNQQIDTDIVIT
jgi:hypothetical protein